MTLPTEPPQPKQGAADSVQGQSPILGIPPPEEQGKVIGEIREIAPESTPPGFPLHPSLELLLLAAAIGFAVAAVVLGRGK